VEETYEAGMEKENGTTVHMKLVKKKLNSIYSSVKVHNEGTCTLFLCYI
jgi:hypothetical protein